jgi:hypothetical protein
VYPRRMHIKHRLGTSVFPTCTLPADKCEISGEPMRNEGNLGFEARIDCLHYPRKILASSLNGRHMFEPVVSTRLDILPLPETDCG